MNRTIKIALVDDHAMFLDGLSAFNSEKKKFHIIIKALNGVELLNKLKNGLNPHIIIMDIMMPEMDGIVCTNILKRNYPDIKVIILTMFEERNFIERLKQNGASAYILKNQTKEVVFIAMEQVMLKKEYFPILEIEEGW